MFVTRKRFEHYIDRQDERFKELHNRYWELKRAHMRLLQHLGLSERVVHEHTVLEKKGGPEPSP